jgi:Uma2 family endonuclease
MTTRQFSYALKSKLPGGLCLIIIGTEGDAVVNCGPPIPDDAIAAPNPVIVVEALSPGTRGVDTGAKLDGYFRVPSIIHYLIVLRAKRGVIHHRRAPDGDIDTRIVSSGRIALDPPGITLDSDEIYGC